MIRPCRLATKTREDFSPRATLFSLIDVTTDCYQSAAPDPDRLRVEALEGQECRLQRQIETTAPYHDIPVLSACTISLVPSYGPANTANEPRASAT
jgi:hypothetical protein